MSDTEPTVTVESPNGPVVITKAQYDANSSDYKLVKAGKTPAPADDTEAAAKAAEREAILAAETAYLANAENFRAIGKSGKQGNGKKFVILDKDGKKVVEKEFETEAEATIVAFPIPTA